MKKLKLKQSKKERKKIEREKKKKDRKKGKQIVVVSRKLSPDENLILRKEKIMNMTMTGVKIYLREKYAAMRSLPTVEAIFRLIDSHDILVGRSLKPVSRVPREAAVEIHRQKREPVKPVKAKRAVKKERQKRSVQRIKRK